VYKGDGNFQDYLTENIPECKNVNTTNAHFVATYIVNPAGIADSLHILESINPEFDKQFTKAFDRAKKKWQPASLHGRNVSVQMTEEFRFISGANFLPSFDYSQKGKAAMRQGQFDQALFYFDFALANYPTDTETLYSRAVCKLALGNKEGACTDLNTIKSLGSSAADDLLRKNCN
jgi:tetratricopeptide (TPR) repeat protein